MRKWMDRAISAALLALAAFAVVAAVGAIAERRACNARGGVSIEGQCVHFDGARTERTDA